jgi:hypothetical protein
MRAFLAVVASLTLAACTTENSPPPNNGGPNNYPPPPPRGGAESQAPVVVTLQQGNVNPQTGETDVLAFFDVSQPIGYPVTVTVTPPPGGQLTSGLPQETLQLSQPGRLQRVYRVRSAQPLGPQNAVHLVLHGDGAGVGVHADRWLPPPAEMRVAPPSGPTPPGGRPPTPAPPGLPPPH